MIYKILRKSDGYILASNALSFIPNNGKNKGRRFKTEKGATRKISFITLTDEMGTDVRKKPNSIGAIFIMNGHMENYGSFDPNDFEVLSEDE